MDAPWSLRSNLQNAMRFIQGNLTQPGSGANPGQRLVRMELAATNGMLSGLDRSSQLLAPESYRVIRGRALHGQDATRADSGAIRPPSATSASGEDKAPAALTVRRIEKGSTVGYLRLETFSRGTSADVERELAKLEADGVKGVVLDLRDNTGGLFDEAVKVVDAFVKAGRIASMVSKKERSDRMAHDGGHEPSGPLVVLVNRENCVGLWSWWPQRSKISAAASFWARRPRAPVRSG